ncbi:MAG: AMP-binding protein [Chloroflexota bacterium]|nr:AMP-binding protein [Chloroflexota bacterium]
MPEHNMTDYEATRAAFVLDVPEWFNWARDVVAGWAADSERLAMLWVGPDGEERRITFAEFDQRANAVAAALRDLGVQPGDRVAIMLPRVPEWWEAVLGIMKRGAVSMPGTILLTAKDIAYRISAAEARVVITDAAGAAKVDSVAAQTPSLAVRIVVGDGDVPAGWLRYADLVAAAPTDYSGEPTRSSDPVMIYFTSGTVGYPKMVLHTHASYPLGHRITGKYWLDLRPGDLHWNVADNGWAKAAWSSLFGPWGEGAALFVQDSRGKFNAAETLDLLARYPITTLCAPPTVYRTLVLEDLPAYRFPHLRWCVGAGEPLNPEVIDIWQQATGLTIRDGYGQTETVLLVGNFPPLPVKPGSMGKPSPGFDVSVIDDAGAEVPSGQEGDIAVRVHPVRPVALFQEYWRNPEATAGAMRGDWYVTGDRAVKDADGYFWFVGRSDDVIISAGYRIGPFEVESALIEHPAVAEAAVVASPDALRGEIVKAFVILAPGYTGSAALVTEIQEAVKASTAPYKYPREIEFVTELPKTISGKIRRIELREQERARKASSEL